MNVRLRLASVWLPGSVLEKELGRISDRTTEALLSLLRANAPDVCGQVSTAINPLAGSIGERRAVMASNHNVLVAALTNAVGTDRAVAIGRDSLFEVGLRLGEESRIRFGVREGLSDLVLAAHAMYRVLGIRFRVYRVREELHLEVDRCALSDTYSELSCKILSATDEGVVSGLNPEASMKFERMITSGFPTCIACVKMRGARA